jgi:hypothetical protein
MLAALGDVVVLPGDGHLLNKNDDEIDERLDAFLTANLR